MKFIIGENTWTYFERMSYRGVIGLFYDTTLGGILTYLIFAVFFALAVIGLITAIKWLFNPKKKKKVKSWKSSY